MDEFLRAHTKHLPRCQMFAATCPLCDIIIREQTDVYPGIIENLFRTAVYRAWKRWDAGGMNIADNTHPETLTGVLAFTAFSRWVQPKYHDTIGLTEAELSLHPLVQKKMNK